MKVKTPALGGICESLQGRDKGCFYVIVELPGQDRVFVADGESRKTERPKKKNVKHLYLYPQNAKDYGADCSVGKVYDSQIAYALKLFKQERARNQQSK